MQAGIITIGDEILIGQVVDTNSTFIASELAGIGVQIGEIRSVQDTKESIVTSIDQLSQDLDLIILTGGLGPTNDDITKKTLCDYFDVKLIRHQPTLKHLEFLLRNRGVAISEINKQQADIPERCEVLFNENGTAPGMLFRKGKKLIVSLPGVPYEMKALITDQLIPILISENTLPILLKKTFLVVGIAESTMADRLVNFESELPEGAKLAYLPSPGLLRLRLSITGKDKSKIENEFTKQETQLESLLGNDLFGYETESLEAVVGNALLEHDLTIATAESCTGGTIAQKISSVAGASQYFKGSVVAYENDIKHEVLGVHQQSLEKFGAVSEAVVREMAEGVCRLMHTNIGVATSGIAGPTGGSDEKPVGTTWIAVSVNGKTIAEKYNFGDHRGRNISKASIIALNMLRNEINTIVNKIGKKV